MGADCPICGTRQPIVRNITADGDGAMKASDVLAQKLACGHTVGGEQYSAFLAASRKIDEAAQAAVQKAQQDAADKKAGLWKSLTVDNAGA
jgi:hypothetical protein